MNQTQIRERIYFWGRSLFNRGLTFGTSGNISVRVEEGYILTPTNSCLGDLDPGTLSLMDRSGRHLAGDPPTKEYPLHLAFYEQQEEVNAVVHLHSTYATALSCLQHNDSTSLLPPITPYFIMRLGRLAWVPYAMPGSMELAHAVREAAQGQRAVLMANHGPIVAAETLDQAVSNMEELEETAKLTFLLQERRVQYLSEEQIAELKKKFASRLSKSSR